MHNEKQKLCVCVCLILCVCVASVVKLFEKTLFVLQKKKKKNFFFFEKKKKKRFFFYLLFLSFFFSIELPPPNKQKFCSICCDLQRRNALLCSEISSRNFFIWAYTACQFCWGDCNFFFFSMFILQLGFRRGVLYQSFTL